MRYLRYFTLACLFLTSLRAEAMEKDGEKRHGLSALWKNSRSPRSSAAPSMHMAQPSMDSQTADLKVHEIWETGVCTPPRNNLSPRVSLVKLVNMDHSQDASAGARIHTHVHDTSEATHGNDKSGDWQQIVGHLKSKKVGNKWLSGFSDKEIEGACSRLGDRENEESGTLALYKRTFMNTPNFDSSSSSAEDMKGPRNAQEELKSSRESRECTREEDGESDTSTDSTTALLEKDIVLAVLKEIALRRQSSDNSIGVDYDKALQDVQTLKREARFYGATTIATAIIAVGVSIWAGICQSSK